MNNRTRLLEIRESHNLTYVDIAKICDVSYFTVKSWLLSPDSSNSRNMKDKDMKTLEKYIKRRAKREK